jgi:hypothetical protein
VPASARTATPPAMNSAGIIRTSGNFSPRKPTPCPKFPTGPNSSAVVSAIASPSTHRRPTPRAPPGNLRARFPAQIHARVLRRAHRRQARRTSRTRRSKMPIQFFRHTAAVYGAGHFARIVQIRWGFPATQPCGNARIAGHTLVFGNAATPLAKYADTL